MCKYILILSLFFWALSCSQTQSAKESPVKIKMPNIVFDSTDWTYTLSITSDSIKRILEFRHPDSSDSRFYSFMGYHIQSLLINENCKFCPVKNIVDELPIVKFLLDSAKTKGRLKLTSLSFDSPETFKDVFKKYVSSIQNSPAWQSCLRKSKMPKLDKVPMVKIFQEINLYTAVDSFLRTYGYTITGDYIAEEPYYLTRHFLGVNGVDSTLLVPMPLVFGIGVKKLE